MTSARHPPEGAMPPPISALLRAGQQIWLDDLSRPLIESGGLRDVMGRLGVTGVTSNPAIVARSIQASSAYDSDIAALARAGRGVEEILLDLAVDDVRGAADLLRPIWERTGGEDGWVSTQLSPRLADDAQGSTAAALALHERVARPNVLIKIPATSAGLRAIEQVVARGVSVTVTLLLSPGHVAAATAAYLRALESRAARGEDLRVRSYAALYVSRWDRGERAAPTASGGLGIRVADAAYGASRVAFSGERWRRLERRGARAQTLLFASTGCRDPALGPAHYVERLAAAGTANTIPPDALEAFSSRGRLRRPLSGGTTADALAVDIDALASGLQREAARGFSDAWDTALAVLERRPGGAARGYSDSPESSSGTGC